MVSTVMETRESQVSGSVARKTNAHRVFVPPSQISTLAVTGTWVLEANTNVVSLATNDVGGDGELLYVPFPSEHSDMRAQSTSVDRGVRVVGLEVIYEVAASALADIDFFIYHTSFDAEGTGTATVATATTSFDTAGDTGREIDQHRASVFIAEGNRAFLDGGKVVHAVIDMEDGTASDVNILGCIWHIERVYE